MRFREWFGHAGFLVVVLHCGFLLLAVGAAIAGFKAFSGGLLWGWLAQLWVADVVARAKAKELSQ